MSRLRSSWADILPADDAIEYVMDEIDAMRSKPPSDGIITVSVCCHDLQFAGPRQDSRVKLTLAWGAGEKVFASTVQRGTVSPVFAESFRFPVAVNEKPGRMRLEAMSASGEALGEASVRPGRQLGGEWTATTPVRRKWPLSRIGNAVGAATVSMIFTSTAMLRPPCRGVLMVNVIRCRKLLPADSNGLSDPYLKLSLGRQKERRTLTVANTLDPVFNSHFMWEVEPQGKIDDFRLCLTVVDSNKLLSDTDIGTVSVDVGSLLGAAWAAGEGKHSLEFEHTQHAAHSKVAAGVCSLDMSFVTAAVLPPPCEGVLNVKLVAARNLRPADSNGLSDPYVALQLGKGALRRSRTVKKTLNPVFDTTFKFTVKKPATKKVALKDFTLSITAKDKDVVGKDDLLGFRELAIGALLGEGWRAESREAHQLCAIGSVMLVCSFVDAALLRPPCAGLLTVGLRRASGLPAADDNGLSDPYCKLQLGSGKPMTSRKLAKTLDPIWGDDYRFEVAVNRPLEDYRLEVCVKDKDMARDDTLGRLELDVGPVLGTDWSQPGEHALPLSDPRGEVPQSAISGRLDDKYGRIHLGLSFIPEALLRPPGDGLLVVSLLSAGGLIVADSSGSSDPFVKLALGASDTAKSRVIEKNCDPVWGGDAFRFPVRADGFMPDWRLAVCVTDHDKVSANDVLGSLELDLGTVLNGKDWANGGAPVPYRLGDREGKVDKSSMEGRDGLEHLFGVVTLGLEFIPARVLCPKENGLLIVKLHRCIDLVAADKNGESDSYVAFKVGSSPIQKSRVMEKERNPTWGGDEFRFDLTKDGDFADWLLHVSCFDHDKLSLNDCLGTLELDLGPATKWKRDGAPKVYSLSDREGKVDKSSMEGRDGLEHPWGRVELALSFIPASVLRPAGNGTLSVRVMKGEELLAADRNGFSDPLVELSMGPEQKSQKSRVIKKTLNPTWGQDEDVFKFAVQSGGRPSDWALTVRVFDHDRIGGNDSLGSSTLDVGAFLGRGWLAKGSTPVATVCELRNDGQIDASTLKRNGGGATLGRIELKLVFSLLK